MDETNAMAPAVRAILRAAADRSVPTGRVSVDARSLRDAVRRAASTGRLPVIAEIKPTSPTTEGVRTDDPVELARSMVAGGATALSVLTEPEHFGGSTETLERVRAAVDVPVLRKDFLLEERHLDAVAADAVLLVTRFLDDLDGMVVAARDRGMEPLVEVHTREELATATSAGADLIGVNNRDLARLEVDLDTFERVAPAAPEDATLVAESGIESAADARRMRAAGADAVLVGSAIMAGDVEERTAGLVGA
ncbi:MAG: indole-3-glycerol phosphate synthase [Halanaeroarchaeum sp.]